VYSASASTDSNHASVFLTPPEIFYTIKLILPILLHILYLY